MTNITRFDRNFIEGVSSGDSFALAQVASNSELQPKETVEEFDWVGIFLLGHLEKGWT